MQRRVRRQPLRCRCRGRIGTSPGTSAPEAIVAGSLQIKHIRFFLQPVDEGQKELALEAVSIQVPRRHIRGHDKSRPIPPQVNKKTIENQGIGDVFDLQLVQAKEARLGGENSSDVLEAISFSDGVSCRARPVFPMALISLALLSQKGVDSAHKSMKMETHHDILWWLMVGRLWRLSGLLSGFFPGILSGAPPSQLLEKKIHEHSLAPPDRPA